MSTDIKQLQAALAAVKDPDLGRDLESLGWIKDIQTGAGGTVSLTLQLASPADPLADRFEEECRAALIEVPGVEEVKIDRSSSVTAGRVDPGGIAPGVKNFIAVGSGKGGVGKSTVAANLAVGLAASGARVGLLDADVYGPSVPTIMGVHDRPDVNDQSLAPVSAHGISLMSIGFLIDPDQPVVWRGPMVHKMIQTFLAQVEWGELDYLVIDMPPGTGDIQLTIGQSVPLTGAVIVSTPQDVALADAVKCYQTFQQMSTHVFGVVENMSSFICSNCSTRHEIFGHGGAAGMAEKLGLPFLGEVPLETVTRSDSDSGVPVTIAHPESATATAFREIAGRVARQVIIRNHQAPIPIKLTVS